MTFQQPWLLAVALLAVGAAVWGYLRLARRGRAARPGVGRHVPYMLFLAGLAVLAIGVGRPEATLGVTHTASTVVLAVDVSNSMAATDAAPTRLAAAQQVAVAFVEAQPDSVDIGLVAFGTGGLTTLEPTADRAEATAAIGRLTVSGDTSLGTAILTAMSTIVGQQVTLPSDPGAGGAGGGPDGPDTTDPGAGLGYWPDATIVVLSDGEDTTGPDVRAAAALAASAGVRIDTIGVGTATGSVIDVDGFQIATALDADALTAIAETTGGQYVPASNADVLQQVSLTLQQRTTIEPQPVELTALAAGLAVLVLAAGGVLLLRSQGRLV